MSAESATLRIVAGADDAADPIEESGHRPAADRSRGYTTADVAARLRVSTDKVRCWIERGLLTALNTSDVRCAKPRYVVTPEALAEFEQTRMVAKPTKAPPRRRRPPHVKDYYPDA